MANKRYKIIRVTEHKEWLVECPIKIEKSQLLFDNQKMQVILQVKMFNLSNKKIKSVYLDIDCFDDAMDFISSLPDVAYQGIEVIPQAEFGDRQPIILESLKITNVKIIISKVVFADASVWRNEDKNIGIELLPQNAIESNDDLYEQIMRECKSQNIKATYWYENDGEYWRCTCGQANKKDALQCGYCKVEKKWLEQHFDKQYLLEAKNRFKQAEELRKKEEQEERIKCEEEQKKRQEELQKQDEVKKRKFIKLARIVVSVFIVGIVAVLLVTMVIIPANSYKTASALADEGNYEKAITAFQKLGNYKDSKERLTKIADEALAKRDYANAVKASADSDAYSKLQSKIIENSKMFSANIISVGNGNILGLKNDGTVVAVGDNQFWQSKVSDWKGIIAISAGDGHTVGLKNDGTVVATGKSSEGQCEVSDWKDIVAISAGNDYTLGLKKDGTVVTVGHSKFWEPNVLDWKDVVAISAGDGHAVGLTIDGTVVTAGNNLNGQCNVSNWKDIIAISAGSLYTVGLKNDGTVVTVGDNQYGKCEVSDWKGIIAISAGDGHTVGLKNDGTVVATGKSSEGQCKVSDWKDIVAISAGHMNTVGLKDDGAVVAVGDNKYGQCNVSDWSKIKSVILSK